MKLSNFVLTDTTGTSLVDRVFHATVDIETGVLWWKKKKCVKMIRVYAGFWHFVETGQFTPVIQAEALARSWTAKTGQET